MRPLTARPMTSEEMASHALSGMGQMASQPQYIIETPPRHAMSTVHGHAATVWRAVDLLGGFEYTKRDAARTLLGYADLTRADGSVITPGPLARPKRWRQSFAFKLALAIRGVL